MTEKICFGVLAAGCTEDGGIYRYALSEAGKLTFREKLPLDRPMYFIAEGEKYHILLREGAGVRGSGYLTCRRDFTGLSKVIPTDGREACHLCRFGGKTYAVNYTSGNVVRVGELIRAHQSVAENAPGRQDKPHTHYVSPTVNGQYLLVTDLGTDRLFVYDGELNPVAVCKMPWGGGIRHLVQTADGRRIYAANELACTLAVLDFDGETPRFCRNVSCGIYTPATTAAAIRLSPDEKHLYLSHRGADVISVFSLESGEPVLLGNVPCEGRGPRDMNLSPDGRFLICANERSGDLTVFTVENGEKLTFTDRVELPAALCVSFEA